MFRLLFCSHHQSDSFICIFDIPGIGMMMVTKQWPKHVAVLLNSDVVLSLKILHFISF
jgi:hypothetical protein